eukprot:1774264-Amphidinium_carterae.2
MDQVSSQAAPSVTEPQLSWVEESTEGEDLHSPTKDRQKMVHRGLLITQEWPLEGVEAETLFTAAADHLKRGGRVHAWFSLPCTAWSSWQRINQLRMTDPTVLEEKRNQSVELQRLFQQYSQQLMAEGGEVSFEWPVFCDGWNCDHVQAFTDRPGVTSAVCHGCMLGLVTKIGQRPMKKPFKIVSTETGLTDHMMTFKCDRSHEHAATQGSDTVRTGNYTERFCEEVLSALNANGTPGAHAGVPSSTQVMEMQVPAGTLYSGKDENGYAVDSVSTTAWMDILEIDFQRKLRLCENHSDSYRQLLQVSPHLMEPLGEVKSLHDPQGRVSINVANALQDQEVPDFFATPVMKPL